MLYHWLSQMTSSVMSREDLSEVSNRAHCTQQVIFGQCPATVTGTLIALLADAGDLQSRLQSADAGELPGADASQLIKHELLALKWECTHQTLESSYWTAHIFFAYSLKKKKTLHKKHGATSSQIRRENKDHLLMGHFVLCFHKTVVAFWKEHYLYL